MAALREENAKLRAAGGGDEMAGVAVVAPLVSAGGRDDAGAAGRHAATSSASGGGDGRRGGGSGAVNSSGAAEESGSVPRPAASAAQLPPTLAAVRPRAPFVASRVAATHERTAVTSAVHSRAPFAVTPGSRVTPPCSRLARNACVCIRRMPHARSTRQVAPKRMHWCSTSLHAYDAVLHPSDGPFAAPRCVSKHTAGTA